jgi:LytS/YehU family sensor histidine kinase
LQPLVENAVRHGISHIVEGGVVRITAARVGGRLELAVANPCDADRPNRKGVGLGLENVRTRLRTLFGREAAVTAAERDGWFTVVLSLPARGDAAAAGDSPTDAHPGSIASGERRA